MKNELLQDLENRFETLKHIRNLAQSYDEKLFCYLLEQSAYKDEFKNRFFIMRNNTYIFKLNDFLTFLDLRNLSGSFTSYTNKIGLGFKTKSFLKTNNEVVLNFAYKDGVIKGGQSKDEDKKNEIFFNEILAKDEIDVLFARKALQNFELIGHSACGDFSGNAADASLRRMSNTPHSLTLHNPKNSLTILECQDSSTQNERDNEQLKECLKTGANLLIKGNNLLALHSLKKKFANKVKLIYIDPPYNTGNDSFNYNDNFNHSTWLTFMKNRLEIARDFLRDDGVIFISIDEYESHYCKVLMDEIFGRDNFVGDFIRKTKSTTNDSKIGLNYQHEFLLCYAKNKNNVNLLGGQKDLSKYQNPDNDPFGAWVITDPSAKSGNPKTGYFAVKNPYTGKEDYPPEGRFWLFSQNTIQRHIDEGRICFKKEHKDDERGFIYKRYLKDLKTTKKTFDSLKFVDNAFMNQVGTKEFVKLFGDSAVFKNPKPESLIYEILNHTTNENDLVMDFFAGSGTTLAVAHKMKRRFIGIEQMDYIESITKERLKKVVSGEQGGISKAVDWQGGGSFIYAELMPLNVAYKERIKNINDEKMLDSIYKDLESKAFLDYRVDLDSILKDKEFKDLDLQEKKEALLNILDSNMDYVLYGDIEDEDYAISSEVIELNKIFYGDDNV